MIGNTFSLIIPILLGVIGILMLFFPKFVLQIMSKHAKSETNLFQNVPLLNKLTELNSESIKTTSTFYIRILGLFFILFIGFTLLFLF